MGWIKSLTIGAKRLTALTIAGSALLAGVGLAAHAQGGGDPYGSGYAYYTGTSAADLLLTATNNVLAVTIGVGANQAGSLAVYNQGGVPGEPTPNPIMAPYYPRAAVKVTDLLGNSFTAYLGSHLFLRVDGGTPNYQNGGWDYTVGSSNFGNWIEAPTPVGKHIEARWATFLAGTTTGTGGTGTGGTGTGGTGTGGTGTGGTGTTTVGTTPIINPQIEVDMTIYLVHDQVRFSFHVINNDTRGHQVGLAFVQEIQPDPNNVFGLDAPIRFPGSPYLHYESILQGSQIPSYYYTQLPVSATENHTIRGQMQPWVAGGSEPTPPTRMVVGKLLALDGNLIDPTSGDYLSSPTPRSFQNVWNYAGPEYPLTLLTPPNNAPLLQPTQRIDTQSNNAQIEAVALLWDPQTIQPGQTIPIRTYIGSDASSADDGTPLSLTVSSPQSLGVSTTANTSSPASFNISAWVDNLTDLLPSGGVDIGPVTLTVSLPSGLQLAAGQSITQTVNSLLPGAEQGVTWQVTPTGSVNGSLPFTVTASPAFGNARTVQRSIQVPAQTGIFLRGATTSQGNYQFISIPLQTGTALASTVLFPGLPSAQALPNLALWNQTAGIYQSVSQFSPGIGYWIHNVLPNDQTWPIDPNKYPPLLTTQQFKLPLNQGWNQIGDPYLYQIPFSEVQVFDASTIAQYSTVQASQPTPGLIYPVLFSYDTTSSDPTQWHLVSQTNFGFQMQPYTGYWIYCSQPITLVFNGVDTQGAGVTKAATVATTSNLAVGSKSATDWRLNLVAQADSGFDNLDVIGVAPAAGSGRSVNLVGKPPVPNKQLQLSIVDTNGRATGNYAFDIRQPSANGQTWNLLVTTPKPNDKVMIAWPELAATVPHGVQLTLKDLSTGATVAMQNSLGYRVTTDSNGRAVLSVSAQTVNAAAMTRVVNFQLLPISRAAGQAPTAVSLQYTLSGAGTAQVNIVNSKGQIIKTLTPSQTRAAGGNTNGTAVWDMTTQQGVGVATGLYSIELNVVSPDKQQTRVTRPFVVTR